MKLSKMTAEEKAILDKSNKAAMARSRYYHYVAKEEGCSLDDAVEICAGRTDPQMPEYMVGFKICDPYVQLGLFMSGKEVRERYIRHLEDEMTPAEIELFRTTVLTESAIEKFKKELKRRGKK